tara:strand:- start:1070 stop:2071 length:1002 start_codon:yes stop_codon:yes gene_type:complete
MAGKSILLTGGTGSFGKAFIKKIINSNYEVERLVIFSRDELKQWELQRVFSTKEYPILRYFIGDIRDRPRLNRAMRGITHVIHAAALKQVPVAEYNPMEFIKTNVLGAENIIECAIDQNVKRVVALSTDKAAAPINLYGATKLCSDKLFISANNIIGSSELKFSVVRYGNVMGSRGSVVPLFIDQAKNGLLSVTDPNMTRFNILLDEGVEMVLWAMDNTLGGEIFVPKIPSYKLSDVAKAISPQSEIKVIGIRPGEKMHEELITISDGVNTIDRGNYYVITPSLQKYSDQCKSSGIDFKNLPIDFSYKSNTNKDFLTVEDLKKLINKLEKDDT